MVKMINEISFTGNVRIGITHDSKFLFDFIEECAKSSDWIDISTFSLNLSYFEYDSIGRKLFNLRKEKEDDGSELRIRIICGKPKNLEKVMDEIPILENSTLTFIGEYTLNAIVYQLNNGEYDLNHSKMILSENLAYIGSLNFGLSENYEAGVIIEDPIVISQIRTNLFNDLISKSTRLA